MLWGLFFNISKGTDCSVILNKVPFRFYRQEVLFLQPKKDSMYLLFCFRSFTFMHMAFSNPIWIHWDHKEIPAQQRTVRLSLALTKETVKQMQQQNIFTEKFFLVQLEWLNGRERTWTESENMNSDNISLTTLQIRSLSISFQSHLPLETFFLKMLQLRHAAALMDPGNNTWNRINPSCPSFHLQKELHFPISLIAKKK